MPTQAPPRSASRYRLLSAAIAARAAREARKARPQGPAAVATVIAAHQIAAAVAAEQAVSAMLSEQAIDVATDALLNTAGFATEAAQMIRAIEQAATDYQFDRLTESLVQDAGRAAQGVAVAARPEVGWVRHLTLPSCDRCAPLAGRVYRFSQGFERHPNCDCTMIPVTVASLDYTYDLADLIAQGQVTGLSKADRRAIRDGANPSKVINARRVSGLHESGRILWRRDRMTPEAIYRTAATREEALRLLKQYRYLQ